MRFFFLVIFFFLAFKGLSQDNPLFDQILQQTNQNLIKNYDTTVLVNHRFNELIFNYTSILRYVSIDGISYEAGRATRIISKQNDNKNYKRSAYIYDLDKNIHYQDVREHTISTSSKPQVINNYLRQKHGLFSGSIIKFVPPMDFLHSTEILTNKETVTDTIIENQACYVVERVILIEYLKNKGKLKASDFRTYAKTYSIINKNDNATLYYQRDNFLVNRDSSQKFKEIYIDVYKKMGNHYYRKENYSIAPRYIVGHPHDYNNKGLYTVIVRKTSLVSNPMELKGLDEIPVIAYEKFCDKIEKIPNEGFQLREEAKKFINEPFPKLEHLKKYWSE